MGDTVRSAPILVGPTAKGSMNPTLSMVVWIVAMTLVQTPTPKPPEASGIVELSRLETVWNEAHIRGDADALDQLCADDLVVIVPEMTVMTKPEAIGVVRSGRMKFGRYQTSDTRIRLYGDAAVVTGRLERTRSVNGRSVEDDWRFTKVYVRHAGTWQVVAFHASANTR